MRIRARKVQNRYAKKKAVQKHANRSEESERLFLKDTHRYQSMLTKSIIIDILVNDLGESKEDASLYFETLEKELGVNFDTEKTKPSAVHIEMVEGGIKSRASSWYEVFISELMARYGEDDKQVRERGWKIATGVMTCIMSARR